MDPPDNVFFSSLHNKESNGQTFRNGDQDQPTVEVRKLHAEKVMEVRRLFGTESKEDALQSLVMIDALQRLGIDYHFNEEIKTVLKKQHRLFTTAHKDYCPRELYEVALRFRLLRQEGYFVSPDVLNSFKDSEGKFETKLGKDINGLMELFEASKMSIEGETILEEAGEFSSQLLNAWVAQHDHDQTSIVSNTLNNPCQKTFARFMIKYFLKNRQCPNAYRNRYLDMFRGLAKLDFNIVQSLHQTEIIQVFGWWNELGLAKELKLARDQPLKWYIWAMAVSDDANLSWPRVELTKPISLVYIIDDIFDVYGSIEELTLFSEAVNRWEFIDEVQLPKYMKICLKVLFDVSEELSHIVYERHGWNPLESLKKGWARLCNAFLVEAKWLASEDLPNTEEYLKNGIVTSGVPLILVHCFFFLGESLTKTTVDFLDNDPEIISSTASLLRLWDDLGNSEDENQEGYDGSYMDCYLKENPGASENEARARIKGLISSSLKSLKGECYSASILVPVSFARTCLNAAKMIPLMYNYDEQHKLPCLEKHVKSLLFESVSI